MRVVRAAGSQYVLDAVLDPPEGSALAQLGVDFKLLNSRSPVSGGDRICNATFDCDANI